jgi:hypothetical protein
MDIFQDSVLLQEVHITHLRAQEILAQFFLCVLDKPENRYWQFTRILRCIFPPISLNTDSIYPFVHRDEPESKDVSSEIITNLKLLENDLLFSSDHQIAERVLQPSNRSVKENLDEYEKEVSDDEIL